MIDSEVRLWLQLPDLYRAGNTALTPYACSCCATRIHRPINAVACQLLPPSRLCLLMHKGASYVLDFRASNKACRALTTCMLPTGQPQL